MSCYAEDFQSILKREVSAAMDTGGKVVVMFHTDKPLATTMALVSAALKVSDPNAVRNRNWVTNIDYRGYDEKRKCGVVIGTWFSSDAGFMSGDWENRVLNKIKNSVNTITFQYTRNGTLETDSKTPASNGDDIMELCLR